MKTILHLLIITIQCAVTFAVLVMIYMVFALLDFEGGFDGILGLAVVQPLFAIVFSSLTIVLCSIIGLPIRIASTINSWWTKRFYLAIILAGIGITLLILSITPQFLATTSIEIDGKEVIKSIPNGPLAAIGWLLTAFSILHCYPPSWLITKADHLMTNLKERY